MMRWQRWHKVIGVSGALEVIVKISARESRGVARMCHLLPLWHATLYAPSDCPLHLSRCECDELEKARRSFGAQQRSQEPCSCAEARQSKSGYMLSKQSGERAFSAWTSCR